jgi:glyoxylase-like metal-dependent hydrolase (beta-lactamase superfamily II)
LTYPLPAEPGTGDGSAVAVAPGVLWLRMPLSPHLPWINVWAIAEEQGWSIVDTGLNTPPTVNGWQTAFTGSLGGATVNRVIVSHMHPDHCGVAGWFAERFQVRLWMSRLEYLTCRLMAGDTGQIPPAAGIDFYRAAGWDIEAIEQYKTKFGSFGRMIHPLPASYRRMRDGECIQIGSHRWDVVVGNGHSPEHVCLYCRDLNLFISGDQVLPRISSNVSVYPTEPDANPLGDWFESLTAVKDRVADDVLVLPAHNSPFKGLHARIDELIDSHRRGLEQLDELLSEPRRTVDVFGALFARPITSRLLGMATGEATAHLNYLLRAGRAVNELDDDGVYWWRRVG